MSLSHSWYENEEPTSVRKFSLESDDQGGLRRSKKKKLVGTESLANSLANNLNKITPEYEAADKCHLRDGAAPQGTWKEVESLVEFDRDREKLDVFLSRREKTLTIADIKVFMPFTINLDPFLRKVIKEEVQNLEQLGFSLARRVEQPQYSLTRCPPSAASAASPPSAT